MVTNVKQLRIFIASPSDCEIEREIIRKICREDPTIITICRENNLAIDVFGWEDLLPEMGRPQSIINASMVQFSPDWFVFIFWHRFGSDAGYGMTGTEEEWDLACRLNKKGKGHPKISIYFNSITIPTYERDDYQLKSLQDFRDRIFEKRQVLACLYHGTIDFEIKFRAHLSKILLTIDADNVKLTYTRLYMELSLTSTILKNYPRTVGENHELIRPELEQILQGIEKSEHSTTLVLGSPGTGKSALLSSLTNYLLEKEMPLLVIKADMLSKEINTAEDLRIALSLSLDAKDEVLTLAEREKVVVILDQLDAISELLDRKSGRLNVLLNLVNNLSGHKGIHIIASCRDFEYRHDIRLSSIDAEKINLQLPSFEQIKPILEQADHSTIGMSDELIELLRTPLHLKIYLTVAKPNSVYQSLHALLEELWQQRVLSSDMAQESLVLLKELAKSMAEEESLWLPMAFTDGFIPARCLLERNDILMRGPDNLTIGFRHQTYYDYALIRSFVNGVIPMANYVLERQNGLFIRPTFLSCLQYFRSTSKFEYHKQIEILFNAALRPHLFSLLIEFIGSQKDPDETEAQLMIPLLDSDNEGPKILNAVSGSLGWFNRLISSEGLDSWMSKPLDSASHCIPLLLAAVDFAPKQVLNLLEKYWVNDPIYDPLSLSILLDYKDWDIHSVSVVEEIVNRSKLLQTGILVDKIAESNPEFGCRVLRTYLEGKLIYAIKDMEIKKAEMDVLSHNEQIFVRNLHENDPLEILLENRMDFINFEDLAEDTPESFLQWIWPWFVDVINRIAIEENDYIQEYRSDTAIYRSLRRRHEDTVVDGLLVAIKKLAETDMQAFLDFFVGNTNSDLQTIHRMLAYGLIQISTIVPEKVLEYILSDSRRLSLGDYRDYHRETRKLITNIFPYLNPSDRLRLESAVISFNRYKKVNPEWDVEQRRDRNLWNRQHRLRLLRAFPAKYISQDLKKLRIEEERVFPGLSDSDGGTTGGVVGPRLRVDEMAKASDNDLINLFNQLPDGTGWNSPRRNWEDYSRSGGSIQQSREFKELAKKDPRRAISLFNKFEPGLHELYAGAGLEGLAESGLSLKEFTNLIKNLDKRGFASSEFRDEVASALEKLAEQKNGLSQEALNILEIWLEEQTEPEWPDKSMSKVEREDEVKDSILFGTTNIRLPQGRGTIMRAITAGYLRRKPPDLNGWTLVLHRRLSFEQHPGIWAVTMMHMPMLFNKDQEEATRMYDNVIKTCPKVLEQCEAFYSIARVIPWCQPKEMLQEWFDRIKNYDYHHNHQVYGEMLFLYYCIYRDTWSSERIKSILVEKDNVNILLGLAFGASNLWNERPSQTMAREILCQLAFHQDHTIQQAVAGVFRCNDHLLMNSDLKEVIKAIMSNKPVLLDVAIDLVEFLMDYVTTEPELVSKICQEVIQAGGADIGNFNTSLASLATPLTNIALTLHRLPEYREVGLKIFENLILLNVRETRIALETLDRKPTKNAPKPFKPRRRRKKRS